MPNFHDALAEVGLRINALTGVDATELNTTYQQRPLQASDWQSARFPFDAALDALVTTEQELTNVIADTDQHTLRRLIEVDSASLGNGASLPTVISSASVIGKMGSVRDTTSGEELSEQPLGIVQRKNNAGSFFTATRHYFTVRGGRIFHTRSGGVIVKLPTYNLDVRQTAATNNGALLFATLFFAYVSGALSRLFRDGRFGAQAAQYADHYARVLQQLSAGGSGVSPLPAPAQALPES